MKHQEAPLLFPPSTLVDQLLFLQEALRVCKGRWFWLKGLLLVQVLQLRFGEGPTIKSRKKRGLILSSPSQVLLADRRARRSPGKLRAVGRFWGTWRKWRNVPLLLQSEYVPGEIACLFIMKPC